MSVFAVNARGGTLHGETIYPSISEISRPIDLVVIAVRADVVPSVFHDAIRAGAGSGVVVSSGFAEIGRSDLQEQIVAIARDASFPFIGPNCLGFYAPPSLDTFFIPLERIVRPNPGNVAFVSQSGGILVDHMIKLTQEGVGLSLAVSIGNKAMISEIDLLDYFARDEATRVVAFYVEGFREGEGRAFVNAVHRFPKPVVVLKAGRSVEGTAAVRSHTASIAGDYGVFSGVLAQYGIVEAQNESELISWCEALSCYQKPITGTLAVVTGSGGHGALAVDTCIAHGLSVPVLDVEDQAYLRAAVSDSVRSIASFGNPIDLTGSAVDDDFIEVVRYLSKSSSVEVLIVLLLPYIPGITSDLGARLSFICRQAGKPLIAYVPHVEKYRMLIEGFEFNQVPVAQSIEEAVHMADAMRRRAPC